MTYQLQPYSEQFCFFSFLFSLALERMENFSAPTSPCLGTVVRTVVFWGLCLIWVWIPLCASAPVGRFWFWLPSLCPGETLNSKPSLLRLAYATGKRKLHASVILLLFWVLVPFYSIVSMTSILSRPGLLKDIFFKFYFKGPCTLGDYTCFIKTRKLI